MKPLTKLMIVQWTGQLPDWTEQWLANTRRVTDAGHGWHFLLDHNPYSILRRVTDLGVECPPLAGRKVCDFRPALGEMYQEEVERFDFWGHTDLDCVYGKLWKYVSDDLLTNMDIYSNDPYPQMCGPFSLYRTRTASHVFRDDPNWRSVFEDPAYNVYDELGIAATISASGLRVRHEHFEGEDSMFIHFTSTKEYPDIWSDPVDYVPRLVQESA